MAADMDKSIYIYGLVDPRDNQIKYIGNTNNIKKRYYEHLKISTRLESKKQKWVKELLVLNFKPKMKVLLETTEDKRYFLEKEFIAHYKQFCDLKNTTEGGKGGAGKEGGRKILEANIKNGNFIRISKRMTGSGNPMKKFTKKVLQYDLLGNLINEWESITEASIGIGLKERCSSISKVCKNKKMHKTAHGFIWEYKYENIDIVK